MALDMKRRSKKKKYNDQSPAMYAEGGEVSAQESVADRIMRKRKMSTEDAILKENGSEASAKIYEHRNAEILDNDMNEPIEEVEVPMDSAQTGDPDEDRISRIRQRMAKRLR